MVRIASSPDRRMPSVEHDLQLLEQLLCRLPDEGGSGAFFDVLQALVIDAKGPATVEAVTALQQWKDGPGHPHDRVPRLLAWLRDWGYQSGDTGRRFSDLLAETAWRYQQLFWQEAEADPATGGVAD